MAFRPPDRTPARSSGLISLRDDRIRAYWNSCSNGGRQGLIEAQRFPEDFDGVVANAPWLDQTGFTIGAMWNQKDEWGKEADAKNADLAKFHKRGGKLIRLTYGAGAILRLPTVRPEA
jgi:Tannase and feruloyl esterase